MKNIAILLVFLLSLSTTGCKDSFDENVNDGKVDKSLVNGKGYIAMNIIASEGGSPNTRAWSSDGLPNDNDFDAGSADESELCPDAGTHWVLLFQGDKYVSKTQLEKMETEELTDQEGHKNEKVIGTYAAEVKVDSEGEVPDRCLVVLNARPSRIDEVDGNLRSGNRVLPDGNQAQTDSEYILRVLTRTLDNAAIREGGQNVVLFTPGNATGANAKNYCTMSSVTYVEETEPGSGTGAIHTMEEIRAENMKPSREEALKSPMTVHVERLAAKVEVTIPSKDTRQYSVNGVEWQGGPGWPVVITPQGDGLDVSGEEGKKQWACLLWGWSTNAHARREFMFKSLNDAVNGADNSTTADVHHNKSEAKIDKAFFANWNDPDRHRSYWAVDGYYSNPESYPYQFRKENDATDGNGYLDKYTDLNKYKRSEKSPLFYFSYKELRLRALGYSPYNGVEETPREINGNLEGSRRFRYIPENVLGQELVKNEIYLGASTHVIIIGQMLLGDEVDQAESHLNGLQLDNLGDAMNWVKDKYFAGGYWYDEDGYMQQAYNTIFEALNGNPRTFTHIFGNKQSIVTPSGKLTLRAKKGDSEITLDNTFMEKWVTGGKAGENPFEFVAADVKGGDGQVMLGLKEGYSLEISGESTLTLDGNQFKSMIFALVGTADLYKNGRMYYYVPIRHARATVADLKSEQYEVGDIGVVRNHWYKINVTAVLKPGIPVADPDQPIIPNIDPSDQYLALDIHIVPWHIVGQDVILQ